MPLSDIPSTFVPTTVFLPEDINCEIIFLTSTAHTAPALWLCAAVSFSPSVLFSSAPKFLRVFLFFYCSSTFCSAFTVSLLRSITVCLRAFTAQSVRLCERSDLPHAVLYLKESLPLSPSLCRSLHHPGNL